MTEFETLLRRHYGPLERLVRFQLSGTDDADDVLQEVCLTAFERFGTLRDPSKFKPWLLQIARNKCRDHFRRRRAGDVPLEAVEPYLTASRYGPVEAVRETLADLAEKDRTLLELAYFEGLSQAEIADRLHIPLGTVKSRMYTAKRSFRAVYPYQKGVGTMKRFPEIMPEYTIAPVRETPFPVRWEEVMGWFIVPRAGEKLQWAMYDFPQRRRTMRTEMEVMGRTRIHGIEGVEIQAREYDPVPSEQAGAENPVLRTLVAQLTDTHCCLLAESHTNNGVKEVCTFLDGDDFLKSWGVGPDNCGNEVLLRPKGSMRREGDGITVDAGAWPLDVVGRYAVTIGGRRYDTICVLDVEGYDGGVASEQYLDEHGRTILWRRFNRDDWAIRRFKRPWTEQLPENQRLAINGKTYVHWYDCITDYIL